LIFATYAEVSFGSSSKIKGTTFASVATFLNSLGVNIHIDQGYNEKSYIEPLLYMGIREVRDGARNVQSDILLHNRTGVRFDINAGGNLDYLLTSAKALASAGALLAVEGPNEPNNFPISYNGMRGGGAGHSWFAVAQFQKDLHHAVQIDPVLENYPVFGPSETGAETDNVGLQFALIPLGKDDIFPKGTKFYDYANIHNYVSGTRNQYGDNQAWNAADPILSGEWDGLYANSGLTWFRHYQGYTDAQLKVLPRVTTETGWDTKLNTGGQRVQATVLVNTYLAQFRRGWRYTFIYELRDGEGGGGNQGLYTEEAPKLSAQYIHNLTTILSGGRTISSLDHLDYWIRGEPITVHEVLLQKTRGIFDLVVWDERVKGGDVVTVHFGKVAGSMDVYDITKGTAPFKILRDVDAVHLELTDHAVIVEFHR
jgi:hypothetical protein